MIKNVVSTSINQTLAITVEEPTIKRFKILMSGEWVGAYGINVINTCDTPIHHLFICPPYPAHNLDSFHPEIGYHMDDQTGYVHYLDRGGFFKIYKEGNNTVFARIDAQEFALLQNKNKPKSSNRLKELVSRV